MERLPDESSYVDFAYHVSMLKEFVADKEIDDTTETVHQPYRRSSFASQKHTGITNNRNLRGGGGMTFRGVDGSNRRAGRRLAQSVVVA